MSRAAWLTDIHLNFLSPVQMEKFYSLVRSSHSDLVFLTGDIGEAPRLIWYLKQIEARFQCPVYFVLGNHDYYMSSFDEVHEAVATFTAQSQWCHWMRQVGIVELAPDTGLIGYDGWADGRCGNFALSDVQMNDYVAIRDLNGLSKSDLLQKLNALGDATAAYFREWLPKALATYQHVIVLTHVPPFKEACWHEGQISDDNFLPHFACKAAGDALIEIMRKHPQNRLTVLCGHTHGQGTAQILDNIIVLTGGAEYGKPQLQQSFEF